MEYFVRGGRNGMGCFVGGCKNGMGCFVRGDKNCMGCFVQGGKSMLNVWHGMFCVGWQINAERLAFDVLSRDV